MADLEDFDERLSEQDWCITVKGHRVKHDLVAREQNLIIRFKSKSSTLFRDYLENKCDGQLPEPSRGTIQPTGEELQTTAPGVEQGEQGVYVGVCLPDHVVSKTFSGIVAKAKGLTVGVAAEVSNVRSGTFVKVICPMMDSERSAVNLYALVSTKGSLGEGYKISQQDCFYFSEFRESTSTNVAGRGAAWNSLVKKIAVRDSGSSGLKLQDKFLEDAQHIPPSKPSRTTGQPDINYANELQMLTAAFSISKQPSVLRKLKAHLSQDKETLNFVSATQLLRAFVSYEGEFSEQDARALASMSSWWGDSAVDSTMLQQVRSELKTFQIEVDARLVRPFLLMVYEHRHLDAERYMQDPEIALRHCLKVVRLMMAEQSQPPIGTDQAMALVHAVCAKLKGTRSAIEIRNNQLKDFMVEGVTGETVPGILDGLKESVDHDQLYVGHALAQRAGMSEQVAANEQIVKPLDELIELLESLYTGETGGAE